MLDAIQPTTDLVLAIKASQPDPVCLAALRKYLNLTIRCGAAAMLCDTAIARLLRAAADELDPTPAPELERWSAAWAVARHAAFDGQQPKQIAHLLGRLSILLPGSPDDPDEVASLVRAAVSEVSS